MNKTPLVKFPTTYQNNSIYIKREDLIPFCFGGNKYRIAKEYLSDMESQGKDCLIGYGNVRSNLARVLANLCVSKAVPCHIICPSDDNLTDIATANSQMVKLCGAVLHHCTKHNVPETVDSVLALCKLGGHNPYYVNGDRYGKGNEATPVKAYAKAYSEIVEVEKELGFDFDYIFLATGTGMTQSGLIAGQVLAKKSSEIIGISIARNKDSEINIIENYLDAFFKNLGIKPPALYNIKVDDNYLCGGYGKYNNAILKTIEDVFCNSGITLDPTYTGKAFYGMKQWLNVHHIEGKKILFIHTGGTPLFFDALPTLNNSDAKISKLENTSLNQERLRSFLDTHSEDFAVSLKSRVNLKELSEKLLTLGYVFIAEQNGKIQGTVCGYANNLKTACAHETILVVSPDFRGTGVAQKLFEMQRQYCKSKNMTKLMFSTNRKNLAAIAFYKKLNIPESIEKKDDESVYFELNL